MHVHEAGVGCFPGVKWKELWDWPPTASTVSTIAWGGGGGV
jgi:hypothetical protein